MKNFIISIVLVATVFGQTPTSRPQKQPVTSKASIDTVIELVQGGMSESFVIKALRTQGKTYKLSPEDLVKLQKAGVTENIISAMMDPKAAVSLPALPVPITPPADANVAPSKTPSTKDPSPGGVGSASASLPPIGTGAVTPLPADLEGVSTDRRPRIVIGPLNYASAKGQVQYYFNRNEDIGDGIRSMIESQVGKSASIAVLERRNLDAMLREQNFGNTNRVAQAQKPRIGKVSGPDYFLVGEVVAFGVGSTTKKREGGTWDYLNPLFRNRIPNIGTFNGLTKEDKALVVINYRLVNAETLEEVIPDSARGESLHKTKDVQAGLWGRGSVQNFGSTTMTSSEFQTTVLGEATVDAVHKIAQQLEAKASQLHVKPREIEGRVASVTANGIYLALGKNDGVLLGDRFAIFQINNEVLDPQTKDVIDVEAVKVGELVVNEVREKTAIGNYGGQPLSPDYVPGKGYQARLISK